MPPPGPSVEPPLDFTVWTKESRESGNGISFALRVLSSHVDDVCIKPVDVAAGGVASTLSTSVAFTEPDTWSLQLRFKSGAEANLHRGRN